MCVLLPVRSDVPHCCPPESLAQNAGWHISDGRDQEEPSLSFSERESECSASRVHACAI
jgi:hypothetical protein